MADHAWDHPRGCVENLQKAVALNAGAGSPPRMRGKPRSGFCARASAWDHPRGCGENATPHTRISARIGSPPRMRGKLCAVRVKLSLTGITPADAGKTEYFGCSDSEIKDHPRGCGENFDVFIIHPKQIGSPPRMRGKPITEAFKADIDRITPADAGKTGQSRTVATVQKDHPRGCGENALSGR